MCKDVNYPRTYIIFIIRYSDDIVEGWEKHILKGLGLILRWDSEQVYIIFQTAFPFNFKWILPPAASYYIYNNKDAK